MPKTQAPPSAGAQSGEYREIPVDAIDPSPLNRKYADDDQRVLSLAAELAEQGLLHPINVRVMPGDRYEIICGEGRWRAFRHNGRATIPAMIHDCDEGAAQIMRLSENIHRSDLEPLEEGEGVAALLRLHGGDVKEVSGRVGWSEAWVRRRAMLVNLSPAWREEIAKAETRYPHIRDKVTHLEDVAALPQETQDALLADGALECEHSAVELRRAIALWMRRLDAKPWTREWEKRMYSGSSGRRCDACMKRTGRKDGGLFDELLDAASEMQKGDKSDLCLDPACWEEKTVRFVQAQLADNPEAYLLADGHTNDTRAAERYGHTILPQWRYVEYVENRATPEGFGREARGVFVCGARVGKVVDILLRDDAVDAADDAERATRIAQDRQEQAVRVARHEAVTQAVDEALPKETPCIDSRTLLSLCLWFGLPGCNWNEERGEYAEWDVEGMAWEFLRVDLADELGKVAGLGYRSDVENTSARNQRALIAMVIGRLGIDLDVVRARAEEILHAPAD